jgi:hypothetical protein
VERDGKEIATKWAKLLLHCNSSDGPLSQDESLGFYLINPTQNWFSCKGFPGVFTRNLLCNVCLVSDFASAIFYR